MKKVTGLFVAGLFVTASANAASLNEAVMNDGGADDREFVEICYGPGESLDGLTLVVIEGEGATAKGIIDRAIALGSQDGSGLHVVGDAGVPGVDQVQAAGWIENGGLTILLVSGFSSSVGTDIDADNDGLADGPIGTIVDGVGTALPSDGDATYYGAATLGPDTGDDGTANFDVAGVARCADCSGAWGMICLSGTDPNDAGYAPCDTGNAFTPYNVSDATPGTVNACEPVSVDAQSWGKVKGGYR